MILNTLNFLYLCIWATILMLCLYSGKCYPVFNNIKATRVFWVFTFLFFNPILSLLYILYLIGPAVLEYKNSKHQESNDSQIIKKERKRNMVFPALLVAATCIVVVFFEIPRTSNIIQPVLKLDKTDISDMTQSNFLKSGVNLGFINANNKIQTISSNSYDDTDKLNFSNIILVCKGKQFLLDKIARDMQKSLFELPYVNKVTCYINDELPEPEIVKSDIYITLEMPNSKENKFLLNRDIDIKINCSATSSIKDLFAYSGEAATSEPTDSYTIESHLHHTSKTLSIECPGTEYSHEVENISSVLVDALTKQFDNAMKKHDEAPEKLYGLYTE